MQQQYRDMSRKQQQIADFMRAHPEAFIDTSSHELEAKVGASAATIIRFAQFLGYSGMDEMRVYLAQQIQHDEHTVELALAPADTGTSIENKVLQLYRDATESLKETLDAAQLEQAYAQLQHAQRIFILGVGTSGLIAYDLYHRLNRYGLTTFYETDAHMNLEFSLQSGPDDVVLALSYSGLTREVTIGAESAHQRHTPVISICSDSSSPLAKVSDTWLQIPQTEHLVRLAAVASRAHTMLVCDMLFAGIVKDQLPAMQATIVDSNRLVSQLKATDNRK
nr:MurR/RpiR family transcriptional regulator [Lacticaseibacillus baoqingensis]